MLIPAPRIILGRYDIDNEGNHFLKEPYTPEEEEALKKYCRMLEAGRAWERGEIDKMPTWDEV